MGGAAGGGGGGGGGDGATANTSGGSAAAASPAAAAGPADAAAAGPQDDKKDWVALELVDKDGKPASLVRFSIVGSDGVEHSGLTDSDGKARVDSLVPGSYR